jgi:WD40 repeat protein
VLLCLGLSANPFPCSLADLYCLSHSLARSYQLASGSEDNTAIVWDLRKRAALYTIPAHTALISAVRFEVRF